MFSPFRLISTRPSPTYHRTLLAVNTLNLRAVAAIAAIAHFGPFIHEENRKKAREKYEPENQVLGSTELSRDAIVVRGHRVLTRPPSPSAQL